MIKTKISFDKACLNFFRLASTRHNLQNANIGNETKSEGECEKDSDCENGVKCVDVFDNKKKVLSTECDKGEIFKETSSLEKSEESLKLTQND